MLLIIMVMGVMGLDDHQETWSGLSSLPYYSKFCSSVESAEFRGRTLDSYKNKMSTQTIDFLRRLLVCDPSRRMQASVALENKYVTVLISLDVIMMDADQVLYVSGTIAAGGSIHSANAG